MRTQNTVNNLKIAMLYQISILFMSFVDRKLFLEILGIDYLGVHGLLSNVISMLALAELGVGTAIIYNLYKPLADRDEEKVTYMMNFYKKLYLIIGCFIALLGMGMIFILPIFIQDSAIAIAQLNQSYGIFVLGTAATYWTGYKRSLLYADQKNYLAQIGDMACGVLGAVAKIICLIFFPSYSYYVAIHVISKIMPNLYATYQVDKLYPYLKQYKGKLEKEEQVKIGHNVKDLFVHKMAFFVVNSTDNMILSYFTSVAMVGFVGNYQIVMTAIMSFVGQGVDALQASLGNLVATKQKQEVEGVYDKLQFAIFWVASVTVVCLAGLITPFIELWLGDLYILNQMIVNVMLFNFALWVMTRPIWQMMSVSGLFKEDKYNALIEMLTNLICSLILVQYIGVVGVFIGTSISYLVGWGLKTWVLYKKFFGEGLKKYCYQTLGYSVLILVELMIVQYLLGYTEVDNELLTFTYKVAVCAIVPNVINSMLFFKNKYFVYYRTLVMEQIKKVTHVDAVDGIITKVMMVLVLVTPLQITELEIGKIVGQFATAGLALISLGYLIYQGLVLGNVSKKSQYHVWVYGIFAVLLVLYGIVTGEDEGLKMAGYMLAVISVGAAAALINWNKLGNGMWLVDTGLIVWLYYLLKDYRAWEGTRGYKFLFLNPNSLGVFCILLIAIAAMLYALSDGERYLLYMMAFIPFMLASDSRTVLIALVGGFATYMVWLVTSRWRITHWVFFVGIIGVLGSVILIYPNLEKYEQIDELTTLVREVTGKNLFSGREHLWLEGIEMIEEGGLWGYGLSSKAHMLLAEENPVWQAGAHNQLIEIGLWAGKIGIGIAIGSITYLWHLFYKKKGDKVARVGGSILGMTLIIGTFENILLGESLPFGMLQWLLIGIGISSYRKQAYIIAKEVIRGDETYGINR